MKWPMWRQKREVVKEDIQKAKEALSETHRTAPASNRLADELEQLRRQNNFGPRLVKALQAPTPPPQHANNKEKRR